MIFSSRRLLLLFSLCIVVMQGVLGVWLVRHFSQRRAQLDRDITTALEAADLQEILRRALNERVGTNLLLYLPATTELLEITHRQSPSRELTLELQRTLHASLDSWLTISPATTDSLLQSNLSVLHLPLSYELRLLDFDRGETLHRVYHCPPRPFYLPPPNFQTAPADTLYLDSERLQAYVLRRESVAPFVLLEMLPLLLLCGALAATGVGLMWLLMRRAETEIALRDFTRNITHELKTPIAVALAAHEAIIDFGVDADPSRLRRLLETSRRQLRHLAALVEQVLAVHRSDTASFVLCRERIEVHSLLSRIEDEHRLKAGKPLTLRVEVTPPDLVLLADATHLYNVVSNLVDNAVKYSLSQADVEIRAYRDVGRGRVVFAVSDRGMGIAARHRRAVFRRFFRVPQGDCHDTRGYGLGLFYVRRVVELHGGRIRLDSTPGRGSTFTFWLPES